MEEQSRRRGNQHELRVMGRKDNNSWIDPKLGVQRTKGKKVQEER